MVKHAFRATFGLFLILLLLTPARADDKADVSAVLDKLHSYASQANWDAYFDLYTEDATFLGTDVTEVWTPDELRGYAGQSKGWTYVMKDRNIDFTPNGDVAWFDEVLHNANYGTSRGTGVLIRTNTGWKIAQYHLTFPIPNDIAASITQQIQTFEQKQPK